MDCSAAMRLLEPYLDGELDRADARELEAHIDGCAACQAALASLGRVRHAMRADVTRHVAPAALRERIRHDSATAKVRRVATPLPAWFGIAAALCFAFVSGAVVMRVWRPAAIDAQAQLDRDLFASHWRALAAASSGSGRSVGTFGSLRLGSFMAKLLGSRQPLAASTSS